MMSVSKLEYELRGLNATTSGNWHSFASHRQKIQEILDLVHSRASKAKRAITLCVLGAGNLNDLNVAWLLEKFASITLVDIDLDSITAGLARQSIQNEQRIRLVKADLTGMSTLTTDHSSEEFTARLRAILKSVPAVTTIGETFDCVLSTCTLSQLVHSLKTLVGETHPQFVELTIEVRRQHTATIFELIKPGGSGILVFDYVSSVTVAGMNQIPEGELPAVSARLVAQRNFFTGLNPTQVLEAVRRSCASETLVRPPELGNPWVWHLGPVSYLVNAVVIERSGG